VTIAAESTTATIPVSIIGDTKVEQNELLLVKLISVNGASLSPTANICVVTMLDDDGKYTARGIW
jgi:hypothetical protein